MHKRSFRPLSNTTFWLVYCRWHSQETGSSILEGLPLARFISFLSLLFLIALGAHVLGIQSDRSNGWTARMFDQFKGAMSSWGSVNRDGAPPDLISSGDQRSTTITDPTFQKLHPTGQRILLPGGIGQYVDICGQPGCLAVAYDRQGNIAKAWPLDVDGIVEGPSIREGDYTYAGSDPKKDLTIVGIQFFGNGDLLASFILRNAHPYGYGLARIGPDGKVVWRQRDYYHHWPTIADDGLIYAPYYDLRKDAGYDDAVSFARPFIRCPLPDTQFADAVKVLKSNGEVLREIDLVALFAQDERWSYTLSRTVDRCDPLHLNFVDVAGPDDAGNADWLEPGDLLISLRAISAIAVVSADGTKLKRVFAGTFVNQHSAQYLGNGQVLLFDNMGSGPDSLPSRVLRLDLETGTETVVFSRDPMDKDHVQFSSVSGNLALDDNRERALIAFTGSGHLAEIDISSGELLSAFDNGHTSQNPDHSGLFKIFGAWYVPDSFPLN